jgi:ABC-type nitrate/sulfonate/bicarbonate transport system substrate-binding protein
MKEREDLTFERNQQVSAPFAASLARALADCVANAAATSHVLDRYGQPYPTDDVKIRLRDCVRDYTETLRAANEHPEQVLKNVKQIMHDAAPSVESYSALATDVSRWCIEAYFEPS